jgi:hypothetical protein
MESRKPPLAQTVLKLGALVAVFASITSGCAPYTLRVKSALNIPEEKLATVEETISSGFFILIGSFGGHHLNVRQIDDEKVRAMSRVFQIPPGAHVIEAELVYDRLTVGMGDLFRCYCEGSVHFEAHEGRHYVMDSNREIEPVELHIKDKETGVIMGKARCQRTPDFFCRRGDAKTDAK